MAGIRSCAKVLNRQFFSTHTISLARFNLAERMKTCIPVIKIAGKMYALRVRCMEFERNTFSIYSLGLSRKNFMRSMGRGNTMVEFFSVDISINVCR